MQIGLITSDLSTMNGWATYSLNLAQQLRAQGFDITVVCSRNSPPTDFPIHPVLPTVTPPERHTTIKSMLQLPRVRSLLRDCDIVHATCEPFAILASAVAGERPLFLTAHGSYVNLPRMRRFPVGQLYRRAFASAQLICVSAHTANVAREIVSAAPINVINNGVDAERFASAAEITVDKFAPTVVTAGGIKPRKGTLPLVEAIAVVRERLPQAQCLIMGNPQYGSAYTAKVQRRIAELNLQDSVHILGFVEEDLVHAWLAAADVVALPAMNDGMWFEGFGLILLEASAAGTAVVGTDNCGVADAIEHDVTGLIVSQENVAEELPRALLDLLEDPARAERMAAAGRRRAQAQTWKSVMNRVVEHYLEALQ